MPRKIYKPEETSPSCGRLMFLTSQGQSVAEAIGVSEVTYHRWRQEFGGLKSDQVKRLRVWRRSTPGFVGRCRT